MSDEERPKSEEIAEHVPPAEESREEPRPEAPGEAPVSGGGGSAGLWVKLFFIFIFAAALGALVSANWRDDRFNLVFLDAQVKAGLVILGSAALGFIIGVLFLWSALIRK